MRSNLFWLSDEQWERIEPYLPTDVRGVDYLASVCLAAALVWWI